MESFENPRKETLETPYEFSDEFGNDFRWLMRDAKGRRLMFWLLAKAGVFRTTFEEVPMRSSYMAIAMAHAEGRKDIGYRLMAQINRVCPDQYTKMMKENSNG